MTMLAGKLELHGVADVEGLCARALDTYLRGTRTHLRPHDREDALAYLIGEAWRIGERWEPRGVAFSTYLYRLLSARCVDWTRSHLGRTRWQFGDGSSYVRDRTVPLSLDARTPEGHSLGDDLAAKQGDSEEARSTRIAGFEDPRGGGRDRDFALLRAAAARGARDRAA